MQTDQPIALKNSMVAITHIADSNRLKTFRNGFLAFPDNSSMACVKHQIITLLGALAF
jgi:hypothetical protein